MSDPGAIVKPFVERIANLASKDDINGALSQLRAIVHERNLESVLYYLSRETFFAELVISDFVASNHLLRPLLNVFPKALHLLETTFLVDLLIRLATFASAHDSLFSTEEKGYASKYFRVANNGHSLIEDITIQKQGFRELSRPTHNARSKKKSHSFSSWSQPRDKVRQSVDKVKLADYSCEVPSTAQECDAVISKILETMNSAWEFYVRLLALPSISEIIQSGLMKSALVTPTSQDHQDRQQGEIKADDEQEGHGAYPSILPTKSALHFSNVEGFGDWRILISTRADGDLRNASRKDKKMFKIFVKKIRELSNGHFSPDNQKRLTGTDNGVPVYEAKMTADTRLVYHIDCVPETSDSKIEEQVVRIFGIYTHAQMDKRLWHSVGSHLGSRGKEYRKRCISRQRASGDKNDTYVPATFPHIEGLDLVASNIPELPSDDLDQLHALLVLEKYLDFSHELLQSILEDLDVTFPFQVSPQEREIVEHPDSCYVLGRSGTGKTTTMLFKMLWVEKTYEMNKEDMPRPRQIFVTKSRVLAQKVEEHFRKLLAALQIEVKPLDQLQQIYRGRVSTMEDLVDQDDEDKFRSDLPDRFSELQDAHFPLFLAFDDLCDLIEADYEIHSGKRLLTFDVFHRQYWPHFSQSFTKGLDPTLVFSEILGIIKGSEAALTKTNGYLDRGSYRELSERTNSTFATQRGIIYDLFEAYITQKRHRDERDPADRTYALLQAIKEGGIKGKRLDRLYVDEAQDNLLIDALVIRSLTHNVNGLFWAGDTAQTISVGSSFRFDDLKAFLYRVEQQHSKNSSRGQQSIPNPKSFQLVTNYRSHGGIVNCAHSVIEMISFFWPYSIDNLQPEKGIVDGPKPLFLVGWNDNNLRYEQFLFGASGGHIEFGAQQCILVRDEKSRTKLQEQVGNIGLIMTLYESKGLEFNDVLLFNFFEDSGCDLSQWRVVLNNIDPAHKNEKQSAPTFDTVRHAAICSELKFLYVALTRARKNIWIADASQRGDPMRLFWTYRGQIQTCAPGDEMPRLAVTSTPKEWGEKGKELIFRKRYLQAKFCYERAKLTWEVSVAGAYLLREEARNVFVSGTRESRTMLARRQKAFIEAAEAFGKCATSASKNKGVYMRRSAECFEEGGDDLQAAGAYVQANDFDAAAKLYRKTGHFDEAVEVITKHRSQMDQQIVDNVQDVARLFYIRDEQLAKARQLFATDEEELEYLEDLDLDVARADVLVSLCRYEEAAELHQVEGRMLKAIPLYLMARTVESQQKAAAALLDELWRAIPFSTEDRSLNAHLTEWLQQLDLDALTDEVRMELSVFTWAPNSANRTLEDIGRTLLLGKNYAAALHCLDRHFSSNISIKQMPAPQLAERLALFYEYAHLLYDCASRSDTLWPDGMLAKVCGYFPINSETYAIPQGSFLHRLIEQHNLTLHFQVKLDPEANIIVSMSELFGIRRSCLLHYLQERISDQNDLCRGSPQFSPCLNYAISSVCNRISCPREHTRASDLTPELFTARVRLHIVRILFSRISFAIGVPEERKNQRRLLNELYGALHPPFYPLGTPENLIVAQIPEWEKAIVIVLHWTRELAYSLNFRNPNHYNLTHLIRGARLSFNLDAQSASMYWPRSPCLNSAVDPYVLPNGTVLASDVICTLEARHPASNIYGILAIMHIQKTSLPIDASTLCDIVEMLCASIVVCRCKGAGRGYHGITLPRSWTRRCVLNPMLAFTQLNTNLVFQLVDHVGALLETIYTGAADFLLYENGDLAIIPSVRSYFITRLIRAICVLGYNYNFSALRSNILQNISSLSKADRWYSPLYKQFVLARHWDHLVRALRSLFQGALQDPLIQLHDLHVYPQLGRPLPGVTTIPYRNEDDLFSILMRDQHLPFTVSSAATMESTDVVDEWPAKELNKGDTVGDGNANETDVVADPTLSMEDNPLQIDEDDQGSSEEPLLEVKPYEQHVPTEQEVFAATVLQRRYRRKVSESRRLNRKDGVIWNSLQRHFIKCLKSAETIEWSGLRIYRRMFLGPLPHLLTCINIAIDNVSATKAKTKIRLHIATHQELDEVSSLLTRLQSLTKALTKLQKTLNPTSEMHKVHDTLELRRLVKEAQELLRDPSCALSQDTHLHLHVAIKGIVTEPKLKKMSKPKLVVDEEDILYDF